MLSMAFSISMNFPSNDAILDREAFFCAKLLRPYIHDVMKIGSVSQSYRLFIRLTIGQLGHQESLGLLMGILVYLQYKQAR